MDNGQIKPVEPEMHKSSDKSPDNSRKSGLEGVVDYLVKNWTGILAAFTAGWIISVLNSGKKAANVSSSLRTPLEKADWLNCPDRF